MMITRLSCLIFSLVFPLFTLSCLAVDVPSTLPRPDKTPPAADKPVKVYILAGQSNMVGFGTLKGARPTYPGIYLSADPSVRPWRMPVGPGALLPHGVYQSADRDAPQGAQAAVFAGEYDPDADYASSKPVRETTVALGTVSEQLPAIEGDHTVVVRAFIDVPMSGKHEIHAGFGDSTYAIVTLNGEEVYRRDPGGAPVLTLVDLERGKRYPVTIIYRGGGSAAFWLKHVDLQGKGDLFSLIQQGKFPWFADEEGDWTVRNDVTYWETRVSKDEMGSGGPLSTTSNGKFIGPEVPFGYVMGTYHDEPVLLIESSIGNRALSFDFRPPSSGREDPENKYEGFEYRALVEGVHKTLKNIDAVIPGYKGQGYEIAGFVWWQGHKDNGKSKEEYEKHLVNLIQDLRQEFKAPGMKAVVATVGFDGFTLLDGPWKGVWEAQMAVGDPNQHPEFAGAVASVDTRGFWRSQGHSPTGTGYHYNHNAETYVLTGDALGRAMVKLMGGKAEDLRLPPEAPPHPAVETIYSDEVVTAYDKTTDTSRVPAELAGMKQALRPMITTEVIPSFIETAFSPDSRRLRGLELKGIATGEKPSRLPGSIESQLDTLMNYYESAGVTDYSWRPFAPEIKGATWHYHSFDPPEKQALDKSDRYREITFPAGMENWFTPDFDPAAAGWKEGKAPFGRMGDKLEGRRPRCNGPFCGCSETPATFWEKEVLLMRRTFEIPPVKDGHVYRLILGGAGCDRSGEGFAIYVNGKLLTQAAGGFFRNPGIRGAYLYSDILPEFKGGKVTIAIINFLRYTHFRNGTTYFGPHPDYSGKNVPPNGHVDLWMEEAKLSPATLEAAKQ
ncbi:MAG: sialate O-acetylesterase [Lentisphaeria bacterium]|nr:sialate O-acetylesterase [Lentisphaeria bacterium]